MASLICGSVCQACDCVRRVQDRRSLSLWRNPAFAVSLFKTMTPISR